MQSLQLLKKNSGVEENFAFVGGDSPLFIEWHFVCVMN